MKINKKYYDCEFIQGRPNKRYGNTVSCWYAPCYDKRLEKGCGKHSLELFEMLDEIQLNFKRNRKHA